MEASHNGPLPSQTAGAHHEIGDNKAPGGPTSLTSGVSSGVSSTFHAYEDPPGLHEKVLCIQDLALVVQKLEGAFHRINHYPVDKRGLADLLYMSTAYLILPFKVIPCFIKAYACMCVSG